MKKLPLIILLISLFSCQTSKQITFKTLDTDFSKGRLNHQQTVNLKDLEKFHGHLCDGLVVGALAVQQAMTILYPNQVIDRTNLRIVSQPSPCLTDVAIYLTGGRYQFNTFYVDNTIDGLYIIQRIDNNKTVSVSLNKGVKPSAIDSLGTLATKQQLSSCGIDSLKTLENDFTNYLYKTKPTELFTVRTLTDFTWQPTLKNTFLKTDTINKDKPNCEK